MAKSKNGGTRSLIRGRVGAEVYTLGRDGKGNRQQVVRAIAEQVANPRTSAQMANRMIMATVMQFVDKYSNILDHSFDGVAKGQPSLSKAIALNYSVLASKDKNYNTYQEKGVKLNPWILSQGAAKFPAGMQEGQFTDDEYTLYGKHGIWIEIGSKTGTTPLTIADIQAVIVHNGRPDVFTSIDVDDNKINQASLKEGLDPTTILTEDHIRELFDTFKIGAGNPVEEGGETNADNQYTYLVIGFGMVANDLGFGSIYSRNYGGTWKHNNATLNVPAGSQTNNYDAALATYPTGSEKFLNGGDL